MWLPLLSLTLASAHAGELRTVGNLVFDGVPEVPPAVLDRVKQYDQIRSASLLDWDLDDPGMLILTRFGSTSQVHRVRTPGGDRRQLTFFAEPVAGAAWDPARGGTGFYLLMDRGGAEAYQIYWYDLQKGAASLLTDGKSRNEGLVVSHGGGRVAWTATRRNGKDFDVWTMDTRDPTTARMLVEVEGQWNVLAWSDDDRRLLLHDYVSVNESYLWIADAQTGEKAPVDAAAGPVNHGAATFAGGAVWFTSDEGSDFLRLYRYDPATRTKTVVASDPRWDVGGFAVSRDGRWLAWLVDEGGRSALWLGRAEQPARARRVALPLGVVGGLSFDRASKRLGVTMSTADSAGDVWTLDLAGAATRWTTSEIAGLDPAVFVQPELVDTASFDGLRVPSWYWRPRSGEPAPVVVTVHGGPEGQANAGFSANVQYYATELGLAVVAPNVRGSTGYGKRYVLMDNGVRRMDSVRDLGAVLDWVRTRGELDAGRVAVLGGSYGGFMSLAALVHYGDRLRCAVDMVGISNFVTFLERTEAYRRDLRRAEYGDERDPAVRDVLVDVSPLTHVDRIQRPLLVGQGANDPRVPQNEAEQIVKSVRERGGTAWYVLARDEGHGFRKLENRDQWLATVSLFFRTYLLPEHAPPPGP